MMRPFVLASASPARKKLLQQAGIEPLVYPSDFDESVVMISEPNQLVQVLAEGKARSTMRLLWENRTGLPENFFSRSAGLLLGCDSVLAIEDKIHGKPKDASEAIDRWKMMRGKMGKLYTGHALIQPYTENGTLLPYPPLVRTQITQVFFADVSDQEIEAYVATGEPLHCAGCFALEGKGSLFVEKIEGCHTNVIGLSMPLLRQMLAEWGYNATDFWKR
jgi:septum formation protein